MITNSSTGLTGHCNKSLCEIQSTDICDTKMHTCHNYNGKRRTSWNEKSIKIDSSSNVVTQVVAKYQKWRHYKGHLLKCDVKISVTTCQCKFSLRVCIENASQEH